MNEKLNWHFRKLCIVLLVVTMAVIYGAASAQAFPGENNPSSCGQNADGTLAPCDIGVDPNVTVPQGSLPRTGIDSAPLAQIAVLGWLLLIGGTAVTAVSRKMPR